MQQVTTFGEIMLRLTTPGFQRFGQASHFEITFGGAEANVAVMISQLGGAAAYVTKLPQNEIADRALAELRGLGVDVSRTVRGGDRIGVYFLEQGASQRAGKVIYDRAHSALADAQPSDFDWDRILEGTNWFHWSGISPALSPAAAQITADACAAARRKGVTISFDLNYRAKLWSREDAGRVLRPLMEYVDLCVISAEEVRTIFGLAAATDDEAMHAMAGEFGIGKVAFTCRQASSASTTGWGATILSEASIIPSSSHDITIVDRVGAGDSFTGALIFATQRGDSPEQAINFAVAASCLKHTVPGDYNLVSLAEVEALAAGRHGGRVQR